MGSNDALGDGNHGIQVIIKTFFHENFTCSAFEAKLNELGEKRNFFYSLYGFGNRFPTKQDFKKFSATMGKWMTLK